MVEKKIVENLNAGRLDFIRLLGGEVLSIDLEAGTCTFQFDIGTELCHSVDVVQGGFVTAMLDATMSHAAFGLLEGVLNVATLEIKVSFLEPSRAGRFTAVGKLLRVGKSIGFMTAELFNAAGDLTATATTTAKLVRAR